MIAIKAGDARKVATLLQHAGDNLNSIVNAAQNTPLHLATGIYSPLSLFSLYTLFHLCISIKQNIAHVQILKLLLQNRDVMVLR